MNNGLTHFDTAGQAVMVDVHGKAETHRIAAIQATERTGHLIPLCHPLPLTKVSADFTLDPDLQGVRCEVTVETVGRTGRKP